jgi:hypothetical protein
METDSSVKVEHRQDSAQNSATAASGAREDGRHQRSNPHDRRIGKPLELLALDRSRLPEPARQARNTNDEAQQPREEHEALNRVRHANQTKGVVHLDRGTRVQWAAAQRIDQRLRQECEGAHPDDRPKARVVQPARGKENH